MNRLLWTTAVGSLVVLLTLTPAGGSGEKTTAKEALQELNDFIGEWKGSGTSEKNKSEIWKEKLNWGWRFKGQDAWLSIDFADSKLYKNGELRYLADKNRYQLKLTDKAGQPAVFEGELKNKKLILERQDEKKDTHQLVVNTAGGGIRLIWNFAVKPADRTLFTKTFQIALTKEGEALGGGAKKPECVVTGGLGTSTVMYKGVTYYVCCSGCRDAFNENPEKIIKEYEAKKKK